METRNGWIIIDDDFNRTHAFKLSKVLAATTITIVKLRTEVQYGVKVLLKPSSSLVITFNDKERAEKCLACIIEAV